MRVQRTLFGTALSGEPVYAYTLLNRQGMKAEIITCGAALRALWVPDKRGKMKDVVLGYDNLAGYETDACYLGATVGRVANRIRGGAFDLDGKTYDLEKNDGKNHLHGGGSGFHRRVWSATALEDGVALTLYSPDMDGGYPGGLSVTVCYRLRDDNTLHIAYTAASDAKTPLNLTNHSYFNLKGQGEGDILDHRLRLLSRFYTPADEQCLPTGEIHAVCGTPMDFSAPKAIGKDIHADFAQTGFFGGYDHNYALDEGAQAYREVAEVFEPESGRAMKVFTDLPGVQLYTANGMQAVGKGGAAYGDHCAFCLETQYFPDSIHHAHFTGPELEAGRLYKSETAYQFFW